MADYVTHGKIQFIKIARPVAARAPADADPGAPPPKETVRIAPTDDYAIKHRGRRYVIFIHDALPTIPPDPPNLHPTRTFNVEYEFTFSPHFSDILRGVASNGTCLEVTIDDTNQIIAITLPATP